MLSKYCNWRKDGLTAFENNALSQAQNWNKDCNITTEMCFCQRKPILFVILLLIIIITCLLFFRPRGNLCLWGWSQYGKALRSSTSNGYYMLTGKHWLDESELLHLRQKLTPQPTPKGETPLAEYHSLGLVGAVSNLNNFILGCKQPNVR